MVTLGIVALLGVTTVGVSARRAETVSAHPIVMMRFSSAQTRSLAEWKETAKAFAANPGCCNDIWFSTGESFPSLDWHRSHLVTLRQAAADVRALGIGVSLQFEATIGHGDNFPTAEEKAIFDKPWTGWTGPDGTECRYCNCPRQPGFLQRIADVSELYAEIRPDVVWIDDDLRLTNHNPVRGQENVGCWCATCVAAFAAETGRAWTRETLRAACGKDEALRDRWHDFSARSLAEVACTSARAFRKVSPKTRVGLQSGTAAIRANTVILRALAAATDGTTCFRAGGGQYYDASPYEQIAKSWDMTASRKAFRLDDVVDNWCTEVESYPRAYGSRSVRSIALESFSSLAWGMDTVSLFVMDRRSETDGVYAKYLLSPLCRVTKFLNDYCAANRGTVPAGFTFPVSGCDNRILAGIPVIPGVGASWGEIPAERAAYPGLGAVWGDCRTNLIPDFAKTPSAKLQAVRDRIGGSAPVWVRSPYVGTVMPRVDSSGAVRTIGLIGARLDPQTDIVLSVVTPSARATWHELDAEPKTLVARPVGGRAQFVLPSLGAWNAGYLEL